ncbi:MAG: sulfurtransferase [Chloroflexi bacterium]|nr:sulfurtransferase [Chloroflexota bacterium]MCY4248106.1 sulfurtransferase [Chloroflexota bacterium]
MTSTLVQTDWLHEHLDDADLRVVEIRGKVLPPTEPPPHYLSDRAGYEAAHIPGAVYVDWQVDIVEPGSPSNDIAAPARFSALMQALGINSHTRVVVADDAGGMFAARLRWALRYYGHAQVQTLDGGWTKWRKERRPTSQAIPHYPRGEFDARPIPSLKATAADILPKLATGGMQLIDTRSPGEYSGAASRAQHGGHIPTAINLPRSTLVAADMRLKSADELRRIFTAHGIDLDAADTVLYCNSGVSATYGMLAMEVAGAQNLRIYDGSWKEWGGDETTPKAR